MHMAGPAINLVQVFRTCRDLHWEFLRLWTGFELPSSCANLPGYAPNLNRNILDFMRWSDFGLGAQDLNDIQRPKPFQTNMAGYLITPVLVFWTLPDLHWEFLRLWTGFELPSSCRTLPCYAAHLNRNILDFMK
jgi:hypothetical protein